MPILPVVEIEEEIYSYEPADNGAGPLWCHGSTIVARRDSEVYIAALETLPGQKPLNNCRWSLYGRRSDGWQLLHRDSAGRTREPSPIALLGNGDLLVSANPTLSAPGTYNGPAEPSIARFATTDWSAAPVRELPQWQGQPAFTEHSYRTVSADRDNDEVLYMQNVGYDVAHLSFLGREGKWRGLGTLAWPWGGEYPTPQPLRLCYPNVFLRDRAVHFLGVGDIVEPVAAWKKAKRQITGRDWDYVFRRLFYAYTPDLIEEPFGAWIEIANRDSSAGHIRNGDLHLADDGTVHLLWTETNIDHRLRDRFFPGRQITHTLEHLTLKEGQIQTRRTLVRALEGEAGPVPHLARFHALEDNTLVIIGQFTGIGPGPVYRCALAGENQPEWIDIPFSQPMPGTFLTNTIRGGSSPSSLIDIVGMSPTSPNTLGYAQIKIEKRE